VRTGPFGEHLAELAFLEDPGGKQLVAWHGSEDPKREPGEGVAELGLVAGVNLVGLVDEAWTCSSLLASLPSCSTWNASMCRGPSSAVVSVRHTRPSGPSRLGSG
jgi:hypothetical protein